MYYVFVASSFFFSYFEFIGSFTESTGGLLEISRFAQQRRAQPISQRNYHPIIAQIRQLVQDPDCYGLKLGQGCHPFLQLQP